MTAEHPDSRLVQVFKTDDPAVLPLATMALESEGIKYFVHSEGKADSLEWAMSQTPTIRPRVIEILVTDDVAARARELLADLQSATPVQEALTTADPPPTVLLENVDDSAPLGTITESQLQELSSRLPEDGVQQFRVTAAIVDMLAEAGVDAELVALLRQAIGDRSELVIRWVVR